MNSFCGPKDEPDEREHECDDSCMQQCDGCGLEFCSYDPKYEHTWWTDHQTVLCIMNCGSYEE